VNRESNPQPASALDGLRRGERSTLNVQHPTSNIEHRTSDIEHRTSNGSFVRALSRSLAIWKTRFSAQRNIFNLLASALYPSAVFDIKRQTSDMKHRCKF
jgi:hypothetical protein